MFLYFPSCHVKKRAGVVKLRTCNAHNVRHILMNKYRALLVTWYTYSKLLKSYILYVCRTLIGDLGLRYTNKGLPIRVQRETGALGLLYSMQGPLCRYTLTWELGRHFLPNQDENSPVNSYYPQQAMSHTDHTTHTYSQFSCLSSSNSLLRIYRDYAS